MYAVLQYHMGLLGNLKEQCFGSLLYFCECVNQYLSYSKVGDFDGLIGSEQKVAWLDVLVDDPSTVQVLQSVYQLHKVSADKHKSITNTDHQHYS